MNIFILMFGLAIIIGVCIFAQIFGTKNIDKIFIFLMFASIGIRTSLRLIPESAMGIRYLQGTWILYLTDIPIIYLFARWHKIKKGNLNQYSSYKYAVLYFLIAFVSIFQAYNKQSSFWGAMNLLKFIALFIICADYISFGKHRKCIINGTATGIIFQGCIAILQRITGGAVGLSFFGEVETAFRTRLVDGEISTGIAGTFAHSSDIAVFMVFALAIIFFNAKYIGKIKMIVLVGFDIVIVMLAQSRTVMIMTAFILMFNCVKLFKRKMKRWEFAILIFLPVTAMVIFVVRGDLILDVFLNSDYNKQISNRLTQWAIGWGEIIKRPILGHGINNYMDYMQVTYPTLYDVEFYYKNPIHNVFLQIWFDMGIFGMITFILLIISNFVNYIKKKQKDAFNFVGIAIVMVAIFYCFTGWGFLKEPTANMLWMAMGFVNNNSMEIAHGKIGENC